MWSIASLYCHKHSNRIRRYYLFLLYIIRKYYQSRNSYKILRAVNISVLETEITNILETYLGMHESFVYVNQFSFFAFIKMTRRKIKIIIQEKTDSFVLTSCFCGARGRAAFNLARTVTGSVPDTTWEETYINNVKIKKYEHKFGQKQQTAS